MTTLRLTPTAAQSKSGRSHTHFLLSHFVTGASRRLPEGPPVPRCTLAKTWGENRRRGFESGDGAKRNDRGSNPDAPITPLGDCTANERNESLYALRPRTQVVADGIEGGTTLVLGYDAETNTYLVSPEHAVEETDDHWANSFYEGDIR